MYLCHPEFESLNVTLPAPSETVMQRKQKQRHLWNVQLIKVENFKEYVPYPPDLPILWKNLLLFLFEEFPKDSVNQNKELSRGQKFTCYRWEPLIQYWFNTGFYDIEHTKRFTTSKDEQLAHCRTGIVLRRTFFLSVTKAYSEKEVQLIQREVELITCSSYPNALSLTYWKFVGA